MKLPCFFHTTAALIIIFGVYLFIPPSGYSNSNTPKPKEFTYAIVHEFPHDPKAFVQGLAWDDGSVYEGTGRYDQSSLRRVDLNTGEVELKLEYDEQIFAEGITVYKDSIYQLTWKNNLIFQYDKHDISHIKSWRFSRQGWGITHDNEHLIVSDGTDKLFFLAPTTLIEQRRISVHDDQGPVYYLNELEYINGKIYANIWETDRIAIIDPKNGVVTGYLDLSGLASNMKSAKKTDALNGIMYDPESGRLFVTGKLWPSLFEIEVVPVAQ